MCHDICDDNLLSMNSTMCIVGDRYPFDILMRRILGRWHEIYWILIYQLEIEYISIDKLLKWLVIHSTLQNELRKSNVQCPIFGVRPVKEESAGHFIQFISGAITTQCQKLSTTHLNNYLFDSLRARYNWYQSSLCSYFAGFQFMNAHFLRGWLWSCRKELRAAVGLLACRSADSSYFQRNKRSLLVSALSTGICW